MTNTKLENIVATATNTTAYLGRLLWFSLGSLVVRRDEVEAKYIELEIPADYLPPKSSSTAASCFKRSVKVAEKRSTNADGNIEILMIRALGANQRVMVREIQDLAGNQLAYKEIGVWILDGNGEPHRTKRNPCDPATCSEHQPHKLISKPLTNNGDEEVFLELDQKVRDEFELQLVGVVESQFRSVMNYALYGWGAISMRDTGGVYFTPEEFAELLEKFTALFQWLAPMCRTTTKIELVSIPVVNDDDRRKMVEEKYETEAAEELYKLIDEVKELLTAGDKVPQRTIGRLQARFVKAQSTKEQYEKFLNAKMSKTGSALKLARMQLHKLLTNGSAAEL